MIKTKESELTTEQTQEIARRIREATSAIELALNEARGVPFIQRADLYEDLAETIANRVKDMKNRAK